jgi:hypothetical protein
MGPGLFGLLKGDPIESDMRASHGIGTIPSPVNDVLEPATVLRKELHQG